MVLRGKVTIIKIKNVFNSADLFTKYLERKLIDEAVGQMLHRFEDGRSEIAPQVGIIDDGKYDDNHEDNQLSMMPTKASGQLIKWLMSAESSQANVDEKTMDNLIGMIKISYSEEGAHQPRGRSQKKRGWQSEIS